jgi:hypothetical protein
MEDVSEMNRQKKQKSNKSNQVNRTKFSQPSSTIGACKGKAEARNKKVGNKRNHKVVIIGDSHSRGLAKQMQYHLKKNFEVTGFVKPGAGAEEIVNLAMSDIVNLTKSDMVVFCGGSNDVSKNKANVALKHILNFMKVNDNTNIFLLSAPHRHDLMNSSCVNNEIKSFNRKLKKYAKTSKHTLVLEVDPNREFFTQHGLHLNGRGKEKVAKQIVETFSTILEKKEEVSISLGWKSDVTKADITKATLRVSSPNQDEKERRNCETNRCKENQSVSPSQVAPHCTRRKRRPPVRNSDFLWE